MQQEKHKGKRRSKSNKQLDQGQPFINKNSKAKLYLQNLPETVQFQWIYDIARQLKTHNNIDYHRQYDGDKIILGMKSKQAALMLEHQLKKRLPQFVQFRQDKFINIAQNILQKRRQFQILAKQKKKQQEKNQQQLFKFQQIKIQQPRPQPVRKQHRPQPIVEQKSDNLMAQQTQNITKTVKDAAKSNGPLIQILCEGGKNIQKPQPEKPENVQPEKLYNIIRFWRFLKENI